MLKVPFPPFSHDSPSRCNFNFLKDLLLETTDGTGGVKNLSKKVDMMLNVLNLGRVFI